MATEATTFMRDFGKTYRSDTGAHLEAMRTEFHGLACPPCPALPEVAIHAPTIRVQAPDLTEQARDLIARPGL